MIPRRNPPWSIVWPNLPYLIKWSTKTTPQNKIWRGEWGDEVKMRWWDGSEATKWKMKRRGVQRVLSIGPRLWPRKVDLPSGECLPLSPGAAPKPRCKEVVRPCDSPALMSSVSLHETSWWNSWWTSWTKNLGIVWTGPWCSWCLTRRPMRHRLEM